MRLIHARNVNHALRLGLLLLEDHGVREPSRAGVVLAASVPVVTITDRPTERVLFSPARAANPFFHLFESLWMLAGRRDGQFLDQFVHDFSSRFGEEDGRIHGAYGHRWREHWQDDQLRMVIERLRHDHRDRRCVIQMWDPDEDLYSPEELNEDTGQPWPEPRDVPCNTTIYPRIVGGGLDLTVCCRSNDVLWGAHGANAVHFSVLQEYMAAQIGVAVGRLYQVSNNYHLYDSLSEIAARIIGEPVVDHYLTPGFRPMPMVTVPEAWDADLAMLLSGARPVEFSNVWFPTVAAPMWRAHVLSREGRHDAAMETARIIAADDWRVAAMDWVRRRAER